MAHSGSSKSVSHFSYHWVTAHCRFNIPKLRVFEMLSHIIDSGKTIPQGSKRFIPYHFDKEQVVLTLLGLFSGSAFPNAFQSWNYILVGLVGHENQTQLPSIHSSSKVFPSPNPPAKGSGVFVWLVTSAKKNSQPSTKRKSLKDDHLGALSLAKTWTKHSPWFKNCSTPQTRSANHITNVAAKHCKSHN